jgi:hypothetical protein
MTARPYVLELSDSLAIVNDPGGSSAAGIGRSDEILVY